MSPISWVIFSAVEVGLPRLKRSAPPQRASAGLNVDLSEQPDGELVRLALIRGEKDNRPFRELFQRHQNMVWHTCYGFFRNGQDAEDFTQETFFKVYRSLVQFEGRSTFKTWLYQIAVNVCRNELRRRNRRADDTSSASVEDLAETLPSDETPESYLANLTRQEHLRQALATLRPDEYRVLQLKDLEQRSYKEIVQDLDISLSAAKMRVQRARMALMTTYNDLINSRVA